MKVGVIGLGRIGRVHLKALQSVTGITVDAISDISKEVCVAIAEEFNIAKHSTNFEDLINDKEIDAVWVCSPSNLHYVHVAASLQAGKYVFCEKPLETNSAKIEQLMAAFTDIDQKLMVGFNRRFDPDFLVMKENLSAVGKPTILKITSRDPDLPSNLEVYIKASGGIYKDMTIHDLDMARFMVGDEVEEVYAVGTVNYNSKLEGLDVDTTLVTLKFKNGLMCNIDNSRISSYGYDQRIEVHGDKGMVQANNHNVNTCSIFSKENIQLSVYKDFFLERYEKAYVNEAVQFLECFTNKKAFPVSAVDALQALLLAEACGLSLKENRVVKLAEFQRTNHPDSLPN